MKTLRWGIISTGRIAHVFARAFAHSTTSTLDAVASRSAENAKTFAAEYKIPRAHASYEALLADPDIDAIYIATPNNLHVPLSIAAAKAGKHVLCEKSAALTAVDAKTAIQTARQNKVLFMEAFMYRCHPQTARILELIRSGTIGTPRHIQATFSFAAPFDPANRVWARELGGGAIFDVGCYTTSYARLIAGAIDNKPFLDPSRIQTAGTINPVTGTDEAAHALLTFPNNFTAQLACGISVQQDNAIRIYGDTGYLHIVTPYNPSRSTLTPSLIHIYRPNNLTPEILTLYAKFPLFTYEIDTFAAAALDNQLEVSAVPHCDTVGNISTLQTWLQQLQTDTATPPAPIQQPSCSPA